MDFEILIDIEILCELLETTIEEFAEKINIHPSTIYKWQHNPEQISASNLNKIYSLAFKNGVRINQIKEQFSKEECPTDSVVLFHGAKTNIEGKISLDKSKETNDFGKGFYCGESLEQSAMFVAGYPNSSLYIVQFKKTNLKSLELNVDRDWMLLIAYFRNKLTEYENHPIIADLLSKLDGVDYIIAPIADNKMFEIIDSFIDGEITDIQCQHCLSATNLGNQYVFKTDKALNQLEILRHCFLAPVEKEFYLSNKQESSKIGNDKVKIARKQYRGQGKYIEEILK